MSRVCGGRGLCGKCRMQAPDLPVLEADLRILGSAGCQQGWRLACQHEAAGHDWSGREDESGDREMAGADSSMETAGSGMAPVSGDARAVCAALDIGTTTVVLALLDGQGNLVRECRWVNPQKRWGADVLSRLEHYHEMPRGLIRHLVDPELGTVRRLVVTGNTVMTHIWLETDPAPLARSPFVIPHPDRIITRCMGRQEIVCAPFAPYVGADIRTGLLEVLAQDHAERFLYMDLGTNGELALYDRGRITACSAACGPALEGAGISIGMPALPGAIAGVYHEQSDWTAATIGGQVPAGVCGSGLIAWVDGLRQADLVTRAGKLKACPEIAGLALTQQDIRMFQLAKGALQAAWQLLVPDPADLEEILIAGGFSLGLDEAACIRLGLFHPAWNGKIRFCGNTALKGVCRLAVNPEPDDLQAQVLELEQDPRFAETFARAMLLQEVSGCRT